MKYMRNQGVVFQKFFFYLARAETASRVIIDATMATVRNGKSWKRVQEFD